jgi:hypothetical protein
MPSEATNRATRKEWRELGFFYDRDDQAKEWRLVGSRSGLLRFRDLLLKYAGEPRNAKQSEHEHYGPYMYLKVMTWPDAGVDQNAIRGQLADLKRLADIVDGRLKTASPGSMLRVQREYVEDTDYLLVFDVKEEGFDPASADPMLPGEAS